MSETYTLKEHLGPTAITQIAYALRRAEPSFASEAFARDACTGLDALELKARVAHVVEALEAHLPRELDAALSAVVRSARDAELRASLDEKSALFVAWPLIDWVPRRALAAPEPALHALAQITSAFSAEFAIRPFILAHRELTLETLARWTNHSDEHVRRLVSEGTRPRLPWAPALPDFKRDPSPTLPLLEALRDDESEYVRRSVANHLNDIGKDHPERLLDIAERWMHDAPAPRQRLLKHALRTLVKAGAPRAMALLGFTSSPRVEGRLTLSSGALALGDTLAIEIEIRSLADRAQCFVVDYAVHFCKAGGARSRKVFKLRDLELAPGETFQSRKQIKLVHRSTRRLHAGEHAVELLVGGRSATTLSFQLTTSRS